MRASAWIVALRIVRISLVMEYAARRGRFRNETAKQRRLPLSAGRFVLFVPILFVVILAQHGPAPLKNIPNELLT